MIYKVTEEQRTLFEEIVLDHSERPRHRGRLPNPDIFVEGDNPETGDWVRIELVVDGDRVVSIAFEAKGSAILMASCSLMTAIAHHQTTTFISDCAARFLKFLESADLPLETLEDLGDLVALAGIRQFPARVRCASLPWRILQQALSAHE